MTIVIVVSEHARIGNPDNLGGPKHLIMTLDASAAQIFKSTHQCLIPGFKVA